MAGISYEFKVDLAIIISLFSILLTVALSILQNRAKRRSERIRAYEAVYEDASFILEFPFHKRSSIAKAQLYYNDDPELQAAVRAFRDSHWMSQMWGRSEFIPSRIKGEHERFEFLKRVMEEATKFDQELFSFRISITLPDRSPVYHLNNPEVAERLTRVMRHVGRNLSLFSKHLRQYWEQAKFKDPQDVKDLYEQCLKVCSDFFQHNPREFDDPFYDLLEGIRREYRSLIGRKSEAIRLKLRLYQYGIRHPFWYFRVRKMSKEFVRKTRRGIP